jgi:hypothetical protein
MFTPDINGGLVFKGGDKSCIGLYWCYGDISTDGNVLSCDGKPVDNISQTDSLKADISFYVEQARNNEEFECPPLPAKPTNPI